MNQNLKLGPHDVGGDPSDPIDTADSGMTHWEKFSNGLRIAVSARKVITLDELRLSAESFGSEYFKMPYFERNGLALVHRCLERELFTEDELNEARSLSIKEFDVPLVDLPNPASIKHLHDGEEHHHHDNDFQEDEAGEGPPDYYFDMLAVAKLLIAREFISMQNILQKIEQFDNVYPARGIAVVAKAWTDQNFREYLVRDAKNAIIDMGLKLESFADIICMPQSNETHHIVVCTLCSCYPRSLLGMPPSWYKSRSYRSRVVHEPRKVLAEFGTVIPDDIDVKVHDSNADMRYLILPQRPQGTKGWTEAKLAELISRDHLVGVRVPEDVI